MVPSASDGGTILSVVQNIVIPLAANTAGDGLVLLNPTPASAGNQSWSPQVRLTGQGWATTPVASQECDWSIENQTVQGAASPTTQLNIQYQINGGGYVSAISFNNSTGMLVGGLINASAIRVNGATVPVAGIYSTGGTNLNFSTVSANRGQFDTNGNFITLFAHADQSAFTDITTGNRTVPSNISTYISNAGAQSSIIISAPATPIDGQVLEVLTVAALTTCTILGFSLTLSAAQGVRFRYKAALTTWFQLI
jgi:hypothetical protein